MIELNALNTALEVIPLDERVHLELGTSESWYYDPILLPFSMIFALTDWHMTSSFSRHLFFAFSSSSPR